MMKDFKICCLGLGLQILNGYNKSPIEVRTRGRDWAACLSPKWKVRLMASSESPPAAQKNNFSYFTPYPIWFTVFKSRIKSILFPARTMQ